jgi:hypothetical protein
MFSKFVKVLSVGLMMAGIGLLPVCSRADEDYHPTRDGGNFGLGLELGDPGSWGVDGKLWLDSANAIQPAVKFNDGGPAILQLDYLWHDYDVVRVQQGALPFYIGVGGDLVLQTSVTFAARMPLGISYIFDKRNVPIDIYFQVVPTLWFYNTGATLDFYPELGAHIYL